MGKVRYRFVNSLFPLCHVNLGAKICATISQTPRDFRIISIEYKDRLCKERAGGHKRFSLLCNLTTHHTYKVQTVVLSTPFLILSSVISTCVELNVLCGIFHLFRAKLPLCPIRSPQAGCLPRETAFPQYWAFLLRTRESTEHLKWATCTRSTLSRGSDLLLEKFISFYCSCWAHVYLDNTLNIFLHYFAYHQCHI